MAPSRSRPGGSSSRPRSTSRSAPVGNGRYHPSPHHAPSYSHAPHRHQRHHSTFQYDQQRHRHAHDRAYAPYADDDCSRDPPRYSNESNHRRGSDNYYDTTEEAAGGGHPDEAYRPSHDHGPDDQDPGYAYGYEQPDDTYTTYDHHTPHHRDRDQDDHDRRRDRDRQRQQPDREQHERERQCETENEEDQRQEVKALQSKAYVSALIEHALQRERRILRRRLLTHEARQEYMKCCIDTKESEILRTSAQRDVAQGTVEKLRKQNSSFLPLVQKQNKSITSLREQREKLLKLTTRQTEMKQKHSAQLKDLLGLNKAEPFDVMCAKLKQRHADTMKATKVKTLEVKNKYEKELATVNRVNDEKLRKLQSEMSTKDKQLRTLVDEQDSLVEKCKKVEDNQAHQELHEKTAQERDSFKQQFARLEQDFVEAKQERNSYKQQNDCLKEELRKVTEQLRETREDTDDANNKNEETPREAPKVPSSATETGAGPENDDKTEKNSDEERTKRDMKKLRVSNEDLNQSQRSGLKLVEIDNCPPSSDGTDPMPSISSPSLPGAVVKPTSPTRDADIDDVVAETEDNLRRGADHDHDMKERKEVRQDPTDLSDIDVAPAGKGADLVGNGESREGENGGDINSDDTVDKQKNVSQDSECDHLVDGDLLETVSIPCRKRPHESAGDHSSGGDDDVDQDRDEPARKTRKVAVAESASVDKMLLDNGRSTDASIENGADGAANASGKGNVSSVAVAAKGGIGTSSIQKDGGTGTSSDGKNLDNGNGKDRGQSPSPSKEDKAVDCGFIVEGLFNEVSSSKATSRT